MKDIIFFPVTLFILVGMVWLASQHDESTCPVGAVGGADTDYTSITISGPQLNRFITNDQLEKPICNTSEDYKLTLTRTQTPIAPDADTGPHFRLATDIERTLSKRKLRVIIRARALDEDQTSTMEAIYYTGIKGDSGWQDFALTAKFKDYSFEYRLPESGADPGVDYLGIRPGPSETQNGLEIESVELVNLTLQRQARGN